MRVVVAMSCLLMGATPLSAQIGNATLTGRVTDQAGAAVPGATVLATNTGTGRVRLTLATEAGDYAIPGLAPGNYRVNVERTGFKPVEREGVILGTGQTIRVDFELSVGNVSEQVTIRASVQPLRTESASLGALVGHDQVVQLPLNGRTFITLATLAPGVALPPNTQLPRINGGRPRTNEYLFDGISVLQPEPGQIAYFPVIDAIQEFKIESNSPPAEFGRFNGGVINLTTQVGGQRVSRQRLRVLPQRSAQRDELLPDGAPDQAGLRPQPVRRDGRRPARQGPHVLLRGLPGPASDDRPDGRPRRCRRCCSVRASSPSRSRGASR